jgi:hypothetical protein
VEETAGGSEVERRCARNMGVGGKKPGKWVKTKRRHAYTETSACKSLVASFLHHDEGKLRQEAVWASATCGLYFLLCFLFLHWAGGYLCRTFGVYLMRQAPITVEKRAMNK